MMKLFAAILLLMLGNLACIHVSNEDEAEMDFANILAFGDGPKKILAADQLNKIAFIEANFFPDDSDFHSPCNDDLHHKVLPHGMSQSESIAFSLSIPRSCDGWLVVTLRGTNGQIMLDSQNYIASDELQESDDYHLLLHLGVAEIKDTHKASGLTQILVKDSLKTDPRQVGLAVTAPHIQ